MTVLQYKLQGDFKRSPTIKKPRKIVRLTLFSSFSVSWCFYFVNFYPWEMCFSMSDKRLRKDCMQMDQENSKQQQKKNNRISVPLITNVIV